jgi:hypothetical protein
VLSKKKNKNEEYSVVINTIDIFPVFRRNISSKNLEITIYDEEDMSISVGKQ